MHAYLQVRVEPPCHHVGQRQVRRTRLWCGQEVFGAAKRGRHAHRPRLFPDLLWHGAHHLPDGGGGRFVQVQVVHASRGQAASRSRQETGAEGRRQRRPAEEKEVNAPEVEGGALGAGHSSGCCGTRLIFLSLSLSLSLFLSLSV